jgi:hypothetical protein
VLASVDSYLSGTPLGAERAARAAEFEARVAEEAAAEAGLEADAPAERERIAALHAGSVRLASRAMKSLLLSNALASARLEQ